MATINGINLHYEVWGRGVPLVLIAGITAHSGHWAGQVPVFSENHMVIAPDNRNVGRSEVTKDGSLEVMADDVAALLDRLDIPRAHVLGRSMGGFIALHLALRHPQRVDRLILESTAPVCSMRCALIFDILVGLPEQGADAKTVMQSLFLWDNSQLLINDPSLFDQAVDETLADPHLQTLEGFQNQTLALKGHDVRDRLKNIAAPCLVITGNQDILIFPKEQKQLVDTIPGAQWLCLEGSGHGPHADRTESFNQAVLDFIAASQPV